MIYTYIEAFNKSKKESIWENTRRSFFHPISIWPLCTAFNNEMNLQFLYFAKLTTCIWQMKCIQVQTRHSLFFAVYVCLWSWLKIIRYWVKFSCCKDHAYICLIYGQKYSSKAFWPPLNKGKNLAWFPEMAKIRKKLHSSDTQIFFKKGIP